MVNDKEKGYSAAMVSGHKQGLARRSAALVGRGLSDFTTRDVATFVELGKALTSALQVDQVLRAVMDRLDELLHPDTWYLVLLDESKRELYFELVVGKEPDALRDRRVKLGEGITGWVVENAETAVVEDSQKDPRFKQSIDGWPNSETRSLVAVPLRFRDQCLGMIGLVNFVGPDGISKSNLSLLETLSDFAAIALENARHVKAVHELTITDESTGLYNSRHLGFIFDTEIFRSERYGYNFSLLFVDLYSLRDLKKSLSYEHFVQLMKELGEAFKHQLRLIDFAFYYGDGEFVLLLPQTAKSAARDMASRLHKLFREASWLRTEGKTIRLPARVAVGAFPEDGKTKADLLHAMDDAMYLLKKTPRDGVVVANVGIVSSL